jgi:alpha-beta hydrolase superfamily lysophospholipase
VEGLVIPARPGPLVVRGGLRPDTLFGRDDEGLALELVTVTTEDRHTWDGLLYHPRRGPRRRRAVTVMVIHGAMGNYISGVARRAAFELAHAGFPVLSVNTRMANFGVVYGGGLFERTPLDLDAALAMLRERGQGPVVLLGYGLGACVATYYQALRAPAEVVGLCGLVHPLSPAAALRRRWEWLEASPTYDEVARRAREAVTGDPPRDGIFVVRHGSGPSDEPLADEVWSYRTWWSCCGPEAREADSAAWIGRLRVPVALVQAETNVTGPDRDGPELARLAREGGCPDVRLEVLEDADHTLWGRVPQATDRVVRWLDEVVIGDGPPASRVPRRRGPRGRLVTVMAADGQGHDALLYDDARASRDRRQRTGRRTAVMHVHGNQGNLTVGCLRFLPVPVAAAGVPVLIVETRLANVSQLFGGAVFEDALADLDAGAAWLRDQGYGDLVVSGYSLGATLAVRYAAAAGERVQGLVGLGTAWSLPQSTARRMAACGAEPSYADAAEQAREADAGGAGHDELLVIRNAYGSTGAPRDAGVYTHRTWWHTRGPEADAAMSFRHLGRVTAPILLVQGSADVLVDPSDADRLAGAARAAGQPDVTVAAIDGVGHSFAGGERHVVEAVTGWLRAR